RGQHQRRRACRQAPAERTQAWVVNFRKLTVRSDRHAASVLAFLHFAGTLICLRFLARAEAQAD
ncbi:MAG: hypothetical protein HY329_05030, partial [Chloroflexi bacterium]|nr:hypothetical protein [Chloroflexota bacterium]